MSIQKPGSVFCLCSQFCAATTDTSTFPAARLNEVTSVVSESCCCISLCRYIWPGDVAHQLPLRQYHHGEYVDRATPSVTGSAGSPLPLRSHKHNFPLPGCCCFFFFYSIWLLYRQWLCQSPGRGVIGNPRLHHLATGLQIF